MKHLIFLAKLLLLVFFIGSFGSCSKDNDDDKPSNNTQTEDNSSNNQSGDNSQNNQNQGTNKTNEWTLLVEIENPRTKPVYLFIDGESVSIIQNGYRFNSSQKIVNKSEVTIEVKTATGVVLDSKKVKKGDSYVTKLPKEKVYLYAYNSTSDNYDFYVDNKKVGTVYPGKEISIEVELGQHKLYAKQLNGYILWATEEEKTVNITDPDYEFYIWDFSKGTVSKSNGVG